MATPTTRTDASDTIGDSDSTAPLVSQLTDIRVVIAGSATTIVAGAATAWFMFLGPTGRFSTAALICCAAAFITALSSELLSGTAVSATTIRAARQVGRSGAYVAVWVVLSVALAASSPLWTVLCAAMAAVAARSAYHSFRLLTLSNTAS